MVSTLLTLGLALGAPSAVAAAAPTAPVARADYDVPLGHFYSQGASISPGQPLVGFTISDDGGIPMWSEFKRLGGADVLGYPISGRFVYAGRVTQLTQKSGLVWRPHDQEARLLDIFRILHDGGKDGWLQLKGIPAVASWPNEAGKTWAQVSQQRYLLLNVNPAVKSAYFGVSDPVNMYGLPTSNWLDTPLAHVLRFDNVVIQQWKTAVPWALAGQVQLANGGELLKESGILGGVPFNPEPAPSVTGTPAGTAVISYYADVFQGRPTSSGDIFSQSKLSAASNAFPLGTHLRLSTLDGQHSVDVVNDDHPPAWNHRIDLSKAAFQTLYPLSSGVGTVKVERLP